MNNCNDKLKINILYNFAYQILLLLLPFFTTAYLSRTLGAQSIGTYSYYYSIASYFGMVAMLGINNYGNREIAFVSGDRDILSKRFCEIYYLQICLTLCSLLAYIIFTLDLSNIMTDIMLLYIISVGFDVNWFFFGIEKFKITVIRNSIIKIVSAILIFTLVNDKEDIYIYSIIMIGSMLASQLILWPYLVKEIHFVRIPLNKILYNLKPVFLLFIPTLAVSFYKILDKIMLGSMSGMEEVGFFECSEKTLFLPICFITALGTVMMPRMANLVREGDKHQEHNLIKKSILLAVFISAPISLGLCSVADLFVPLFLGKNFEKCIFLMYILLSSCIFIAVANVIRTQILIPRALDRAFISSVVVGALANIIGNLLLIPKLGALGAAISTLITEFIVCVVQVYIANQIIDISRNIAYSSSFVVFSIVSFYVSSFFGTFNNSFVDLLCKGLAGTLLYLVLCFLYYKIILKEYLNSENS